MVITANYWIEMTKIQENENAETEEPVYWCKVRQWNEALPPHVTTAPSRTYAYTSGPEIQHHYDLYHA